MSIDPYTLSVPEADLEDLHRRLQHTRLPDQTPGPEWAYGTDVDWLAQLIEHWGSGFDWREQEAKLNAFPQYRIQMRETPLHFLHVPGEGPDPLPLLLAHGWPGSVFEFLEIIPRLTDPGRFGGDPADAFTVVAPSLPGYGLSFRPGQRRLDSPEIADVFAELMTQVLGYDTFAAQGGDWGAHIATWLGVRRPELLTGIHLNMMLISPGSEDPDDLTEDERRFAEQQKQWAHEEAGYMWIQGTRPQTLAFALTDSPAGLAAWIGEKFHAWTDHSGNLWDAVDRDRLLANIGLYWFTGAIGSSFWPYYGRHHGPSPLAGGQTVDVPVGYAEFPAEIRHPPRSVAETAYTDIRRWTSMERGGHFAALEQPAALAEEISAFFRSLR